MRLVDKDKLLKELIEGQKAGLGLIEGSDYDNINSVDDAIESVKYADEIDCELLVSNNAIANIINSVTEYMYCNWKDCHIEENITWEDLQTVREEIKKHAMDMIKTNLSLFFTRERLEECEKRQNKQKIKPILAIDKDRGSEITLEENFDEDKER